MSLRKKTLWISGMTITTLIVILYFVSRIILLNSFQKLEVEYTQENIQRALDALSMDLSNLDRVLQDYATWDDTYSFIQGENTQSYIESNLVNQTFDNLGLDLMIFTRCSGEVIYKKAYDHLAGQETPLPEGLLDKLAAEGAFLCSQDLQQHVAGIQSLSKGAMMIASLP